MLHNEKPIVFSVYSTNIVAGHNRIWCKFVLHHGQPIFQPRVRPRAAQHVALEIISANSRALLSHVFLAKQGF